MSTGTMVIASAFSPSEKLCIRLVVIAVPGIIMSVTTTSTVALLWSEWSLRIVCITAQGQC